MSSINQDITLTQSLANDPRNQLERWLEDVEIHARNLCAQWDISGALTLVATDEVWAEYPGNVTNLADVLANGDPPDIRARPTWAAPAAHADNAAAAIVAKYKEAVLKHQAFEQASSALVKALLVSIGDENQTHLRTTFVNVKIYVLTPAQIVTTMIAKHGVATGDNIQRLKEPLSQALLSLSDFERHMGKYLWPLRN